MTSEEPNLIKTETEKYIDQSKSENNDRVHEMSLAGGKKSMV